MRKIPALMGLLAMLFSSQTVYAACTPGPLLSEIFVDFMVKPPRTSEYGECSIDLANPEPTLGDIIAGRYNICLTDSFLVMFFPATLNVKRNCSFTLRASFEDGSITAKGKIEPDFKYGNGTITIKDGKKRQTGKFDLWDANYYQLSKRTANLKSRALTVKQQQISKAQ
jgi:hypothetical protein